LNLKLVAEYRGVSPNTFLAEVKAGTMPKPETRGSRKIWDRHKVDKRMDRVDETEADPLMEALDDC
jgi:predicted site-specific integrase-resolvase